MYQARMLSYYPQAIKSILEFQAIIDGEYPEFKDLKVGLNNALSDAYLLTMSEERIAQWEKHLGIIPASDDTISDRRSMIIARIRGQGKLNTELINKIVKIFTGSPAVSIKLVNGVLCVSVEAPTYNNNYKFANLEQILREKAPAHLGVYVELTSVTWEEVKYNNPTWGDVKTYHETWRDVKGNWTRSVGSLDNTPIDEFVLT